jgi:hypothetical protein
MLPTFTTNVSLQSARQAKNKGDNIIRVTNTRGVTIKVSISETDRCTQGINKIGEKVLSRGLKNLNPRREVTSVVIHIYFLALHELFPL